ncbi:hypothetical protein PT974_01329 [Cladobotryum mycophilum]|uniref:non-specific serine/threonine protein kinase n=1 Tax=Cladobotryum mycophilum TaxID=491253 RepID=A0ABR0T4I3_9HYPO
MDSSTLKMIGANPIGNELDHFRGLLRKYTNSGSNSNSETIPSAVDAVSQLPTKDLRSLAFLLFSQLQNLPAADQLPSSTGRRNLRDDLQLLVVFASSSGFNSGRAVPLLKAVVAEEQNDAEIWRLTSTLAIASTPPASLIISSFPQTPWRYNTRALLAALEGCIEGHESLHKAGLLHRDISINNLMINEDEHNPSWSSFLIDLDLSIKEARDKPSGAKGKTGTRAFMATGALLGEEHSFMHDLESFFWVLFWICVHYGAQGRNVGITRYDRWNYEDEEDLAVSKLGTIGSDDFFLRIVRRDFTPYYQPLIPHLNRLRRQVFPNGAKWVSPDPALYGTMKHILGEARNDPDVVSM